MSQVQSWSDISDASISEIGVRQQHRPTENFKFYSNAYEANQSITIKASHGFRVYVLTGSCALNINGQAVELEAEQFIQLKEGAYSCDTGSEGVSLVKVFTAAKSTAAKK
jgi:quercetin dioxygenase-like cupin family protein